MRLCDLSLFASGLFGVWLFFLFMLSVFLLLMNFHEERRKKLWRSAFLILLTVSVYFFFEFLVVVRTEFYKKTWYHEPADAFNRMPVWCMLVCCSAFTVLIGISLYRIFGWQKTHITSASVKEAVDYLPAGICVFDSNGQVLMKNLRMDEICREITGELLFNGQDFLEYISGNERRLVLEDRVVFRSKNDRVWSFATEEILDRGERLTHLDAWDITEEYRKTQELEEHRKRVEELNRRLAEYNRNVVETITAREILNAKVKIHDELGAELLSIKHYLVSEGTPEEKNDILERLKRNIRYLRQETEEKTEDEYELMLSTAETLGVAIVIEGELPVAEPNRHIVATAIHECFTNTLRHAHGNQLDICVEENECNITVKFTNNGDAPDESIKEKGGLASLRTLTETAGGRMEIVSEPSFALILTLKKKEEEDYGI